MSRQATLRDLAWLLPLAAMVRGVYLWQLQATPLGRHLVVDEAGYHRWALAIAGGKLVGDVPFYQAPLYPYALGAFYALFGPSLVGVRVLQSLGGLVSVALLYGIGCRVFGRTAGRWTGVAAALYAPFLFYEGSVLKESWAILLTNGLILVLLRAVEGRLRGWFAAGLTLGLLAMLRENALAYLPLLVAWNLGRGPDPGRPHRPWGSRAGQCGLLLAGMLTALLPAMAHNWAAGGGLLLTTYQGGTNFYIGNHPGALGVYTPIRKGRETPRFEGKDAQAEAERRAGRSLTPGEVSRFWLSEGLRFGKEQPAAFLGLQLRKLALVWNAREIPDTWDIRFLEKHVPILRLPLVRFGWVAPLGLLGIGLCWPFRRDTALLVLLTAATVASVVAFYVFARYRLPLAPLILLFAGHALARGQQAFREGRWRWIGLALAALLPLTALVHLPLSRFDLVFTDEVGHQNLGFLLLRDGAVEAAGAEFQEAIAINPDLGNAWLQLADIRRQQVDPTGQRILLQELVRHAEARRATAGREILDPAQEALAHRELGKLDRAAGRRAQAAAHFRRAADLQPGETVDRVQLGIELRALERLEEAALAYSEALALDGSDPLILLNLANVRVDQGRLDAARQLLERARASCPSRRPGLCPRVEARLVELS